MSIVDSATATFRNFFRPSGYGRHVSNALSDIAKPVTRLLESQPIRHPIDTAKALGSFGFQTALPGYMLFNALKPGAPEYDTTGPFEEMGRRGAGVVNALLMASPTMMAGNSLIGGAIGELGGLLAMDRLGRYGGGLLDRVTANEPSIADKQQMFMSRVDTRAKDIIANGEAASIEDAKQKAAMSLLQEVPDYATLFETDR